MSFQVMIHVIFVCVTKCRNLSLSDGGGGGGRSSSGGGVSGPDWRRDGIYGPFPLYIWSSTNAVFIFIVIVMITYRQKERKK